MRPTSLETITSCQSQHGIPFTSPKLPSEIAEGGSLSNKSEQPVVTSDTAKAHKQAFVIPNVLYIFS